MGDWSFFLRDTGGGETYLHWMMTAWGWTLAVAALALIVALLVGSIMGILRTTPSKALVAIGNTWTEVFRNTLGKAERSLVTELIDTRNRWAHQTPFSGDDADRALDSANRLLTAVSAPEADEVGKMKMELRRQIFEEQSRSERRKGSTIESQVTGTLTPWREVVTPHKDVASGRYQQA